MTWADLDEIGEATEVEATSPSLDAKQRSTTVQFAGKPEVQSVNETDRARRRQAAAESFGNGGEWWATQSDRMLLVGRGLEDGIGMKAWSNGDLYDGSWEAGLRHGRGRFTWANGLNTYDGQWQGGFPHGQGTVLLVGGYLLRQYVNTRSTHNHVKIVEMILYTY